MLHVSLMQLFNNQETLGSYFKDRLLILLTLTYTFKLNQTPYMIGDETRYKLYEAFTNYLHVYFIFN